MFRAALSGATMIIMALLASFSVILALSGSTHPLVVALAPPTRQTVMRPRLTSTALYDGNDRWWDDAGNGNGMMSNVFRDRKTNGQYEQQSNGSNERQSQNQQQLITTEMEEEVMASARATLDGNTVSRALSSLIDDEGVSNSNGSANVPRYNSPKKSQNSLRDLASGTGNDYVIQSGSSTNNNDSSSWDTQQIALASGATTFLLSPIIVPIIHSLLPPIIPSPSSISFTGAALLGTLSYIVALGDPADQSNIIAGKTGGALGDGVEVGGAVSRIVGRTALQSVQTSAPRIKAAARAMVDYESTTATIEELLTARRDLSQTVMELEIENDALRKEVALWQAVEDISSMYKLEDLKEMARYNNVKGYSTESKNALLRRLVREGILKLDLTPYY